MKKLFMIGTVLLSLFLVTGCSCNKTQNVDKEKVDIEKVSGKVFENKKLDILEIQNFNIVIDDNKSFITFDVKNTSTEPTYVEYIKVLLYDKNDSLVITTYGYIGKNINNSQSIRAEVDVDINLSKVSRVEYERM